MKKIRNLMVLAATVFMVMILLPVNADAASTVKLDRKALTIYAGGSTTLKTTGITKGIKWSSSKNSVATVSQKGVVTAKKAGKAVITAKAGSKKAQCTVTVKKQLSAKQAVAMMNSRVKKAQNITMKVYTGSVKKSNYYCTIAVGIKNKVIYMDMSKLGTTQTYIKGKKVYWYNGSDKKWYYYNDTGNTSTDFGVSENLITDSMKYKNAGVRTFNGKKCAALNVTDEGESSIFYLDLADYSLVGISSGNGSEKQVMTIDLKKTVSIPASVIKKAKYKKYSI